MIRKTESLSMAEASEYITKENEGFNEFIKKFSELSIIQAKDLRDKLKLLNILKLDDKHISKIIDLVPSSTEEINKIVNDVSLDEDESKKVIETVKQFK